MLSIRSYAQIGIGTTNPQATLHIAAQSGDTNVGLVVPSVTNNDDIASVKGAMAFNTNSNGLMVVTDDAGYYIPYNFAIIQITACDADGKANRRLDLALQNNVTSSSSGDVIFYDSDVDNRAEQWTDTNDFTRNNSAGRLLARAWRGGTGSNRWDDPIITVEIKQRIQIP